MSELSSILSVKAVSEVKKDPDGDSLKEDIDEINRCFTKQESERIKIEL